MKRLLLCALLLAACTDEVQDIAAVAMTEEAVGHYCQMGLLEHPGPKAQVHLEGMAGAPLFFSQVRDVVAYMRLPEQDGVILAIYVSDMGAAGASWAEPGARNWIALEHAHFVVGSTVEGGMGAPELVPFSRKADAERFAAEKGGRVMALHEIPDSAVILPAMPEADGGAGDALDYNSRLKALSEKTGG